MANPKFHYQGRGFWGATMCPPTILGAALPAEGENAGTRARGRLRGTTHGLRSRVEAPAHPLHRRLAESELRCRRVSGMKVCHFIRRLCGQLRWKGSSVAMSYGRLDGSTAIHSLQIRGLSAPFVIPRPELPQCRVKSFECQKSWICFGWLSHQAPNVLVAAWAD
jgi:hypothetical protein